MLEKLIEKRDKYLQLKDEIINEEYLEEVEKQVLEFKQKLISEVLRIRKEKTDKIDTYLELLNELIEEEKKNEEAKEEIKDESEVVEETTEEYKEEL